MAKRKNRKGSKRSSRPSVANAKTGGTCVTKAGSKKTEAEAAASENTSDSAPVLATHAGALLGSPASVSETEAQSGVLTATKVDVASVLDDALFTSPDSPLGQQPIEVDFSLLDVPGADPSDDVRPFVVNSSPEDVEQARAFFAAQCANENSKQKKRAHNVSRVFSIMQYLRHPETGEVMITQQQIDAGLAELSKDRDIWYCYVWHPYDRLVVEDEGTGDQRCCALKGVHMHMVIWVRDEEDSRRPTVRTVSNALNIPSARITLPREWAEEHDGEKHSGSGAAAKIFFDFAEYLPHESRLGSAIAGVHQPQRGYCIDKEQKTKPGKYQYGRGRIVANFDFSLELDKHMLTRASRVDGAKSLTRRRDALRDFVMDGGTLREARDLDPRAYAHDLPRLKQLDKDNLKYYSEKRLEGLGEHDGWNSTVVLVSAPSGAGKDVFAKTLIDLMLSIAAKAGYDWKSVATADSNVAEDIRGAELAWHQDARYNLYKSYSSTLKAWDANQSSIDSARNDNTAEQKTRMAAVTTSDPIMGFFVALARHIDIKKLAERPGAYATDISEGLRRLGWIAEVYRPPGIRDDEFDRIKDEMVVTLSRVERLDDPIRGEAHDRSGNYVGKYKTEYLPKPVAAITGCMAAASFLASRIISERNRDVASKLPVGYLDELTIEGETVMRIAEAEREAELANAEIERRREEERLAAEAIEEEESRRQAQAEREASFDAHIAKCTCGPSTVSIFRDYFRRGIYQFPENTSGGVSHRVDCPVWKGHEDVLNANMRRMAAIATSFVESADRDARLAAEKRASEHAERVKRMKENGFIL